jgi:thiamine pyrophosphokinase
MSWLTALVKAILDWLTAEVKKDTKAGDADSIPQSLKDRWRQRIKEQEEKAKKKDDKDPDIS